MSKRRFDRRLYVNLGCERGEGRKKKASLDDDDEDKEDVPARNWPVENWKLYVKNGRHNHKIGVYPHAQAQAVRLTDDHLKLTEEFSTKKQSGLCCEIHMILYDF
ncbi:hypothetical protein M9H77_12401 [Catharanthus roseus]|uniref:Uncharacterized protein n=1 Tax=Catharanthus roseus TaxID=4058 RepID=A0ACC0BHA4_CATRO|nr:hypothetical protein M9H77_12401 [Catharanthus roseus]